MTEEMIAYLPCSMESHGQSRVPTFACFYVFWLVIAYCALVSGELVRAVVVQLLRLAVRQIEIFTSQLLAFGIRISVERRFDVYMPVAQACRRRVATHIHRKQYRSSQPDCLASDGLEDF